MSLQRLDKIISSQLNISRTNAKFDIRKGFVSVDGVTTRDPSALFLPEETEITYKGQAVNFKKYIYLIMHHIYHSEDIHHIHKMKVLFYTLLA